MSKVISLFQGSVIKYMKDGSTLILFANGNVYRKEKDATHFQTTNNKGLRSLSVMTLLSTKNTLTIFLLIAKKTILERKRRFSSEKTMCR